MKEGRSLETFANTRRIPGEPFDKRLGDNRLIRDSGGHVELLVGYYSEDQEAQRKLWSEEVARLIREELG